MLEGFDGHDEGKFTNSVPRGPNRKLESDLAAAMYIDSIAILFPRKTSEGPRVNKV